MRELAPLVIESKADGWRFLERLLDESSTGKNRFDRAGEALLVARAGGRLVAVGGVNVDPSADSPCTGRVRRLYVSADSRGHGIGRRLVQRLIVMSRGTFTELRLRTDSPEAARFYEALGFRRITGLVNCTHTLQLTNEV